MVYYVTIDYHHNDDFNMLVEYDTAMIFLTVKLLRLMLTLWWCYENFDITIDYDRTCYICDIGIVLYYIQKITSIVFMILRPWFMTSVLICLHGDWFLPLQLIMKESWHGFLYKFLMIAK